MSSPPSDGEVLAALATLRGWLAGPPATDAYDADHLPPGITRDGYLRRHRVRMRAGVEGWTRVGHARLVSRAAWDADVAEETSRARRRPRLAIVPEPAMDALDAALGIRSRGRRER